MITVSILPSFDISANSNISDVPNNQKKRGDQSRCDGEVQAEQTIYNMAALILGTILLSTLL